MDIRWSISGFFWKGTQTLKSSIYGHLQIRNASARCRLNVHFPKSCQKCVRLKRNDGGGVFLAAPSALCGSPVCIQGRPGLPVLPSQCNALLWPLLLPRSNNFGRDWLASQTRYARASFYRRAMHASGDSPCHSSAKHHLLGACLPRMAPFRSMLLTPESGLWRFAPRAPWVPVYPRVFPHSSTPLSRRTARHERRLLASAPVRG